MVLLTTLVTLSLPFLSIATYSVASPQSIGSDLSIITHNDLYGNLTTRTASSIAIAARGTYAKANSRCNAVGTSLWDPDSSSQDFAYLKFLAQSHGEASDRWYWIQSNSTSHCRAFGTNGCIQSYPCDKNLPALCSNTKRTGLQTIAVLANNATIIGRQGTSSFSFLGIKYASIPARFTHSVYLPPTAGSKISALEYSHKCVQAGCVLAGKNACSEDCLSLNIWTPYLPNGSPTKSKKKAVMVWVHGGGFASGTGNDPTFDGNALASRGDVVLITINYRLSNFGFLALSNTTITGNYGLHDQSTALDWIHNHIEAFGGDKERITIFGQSAGASSVRALIASPQARRKFHGAIMQSTPQGSGYASTFAKYITIAEATNRTKALVAEVGCSQCLGEQLVACLQKVDPLKLIAGTTSTFPVVDGSFLTSDHLPLDTTESSKLKIPVLLGNMHDDGSPFTSYPRSSNISAILSAQSYPASAILSSPSIFPIPANPNTTLSIFNLTSRLATDSMFRCLGQSTAYTATKNGVFSKIYAYEFDRAYQIVGYSPNPPACEAPIEPGFPYGDPDAPFYKCHSGELYSVFGTTTMFKKPRDEDDIPFSQFVVDTWAAFARTGDPNPDRTFLQARGFVNTTQTASGAGNWEAVRSEDPRIRVLDVMPRTERFRERQQCELLGQGLEYYDV